MRLKNIIVMILLSIMLTNFYPYLQSQENVHVYLLAENTEFGRKFLTNVKIRAPFYKQIFCDLFKCLPELCGVCGECISYSNQNGHIYLNLEKIRGEISGKKIVIHPFNLSDSNNQTLPNVLKSQDFFTHYGKHKEQVKKISSLALNLAQQIAQRPNAQHIFCTTSIFGINVTGFLYQMLDQKRSSIDCEEKTFGKTTKNSSGWTPMTYKLKPQKPIIWLDFNEKSKLNNIVKQIKQEISSSNEIYSQDIMDISE